MKKNTLSISFSSGKGGVGKSNLALNIGYCLSKNQQRVLLVDCDMGLANMDVLLGIAPERNLQDILVSGAKPEELIVSVGNPNFGAVDIIPANSGMSGFAELDADALKIICDAINPFAATYDHVILDIGAGIAPTALGLCAATDLRILVVTPEPTSLTDSYAFMKIMANQYGIRKFFILVNQVQSKNEAQHTFKRLAMVCNHFLKFEPTFLGSVTDDHSVTDAVRKQRPFSELFPSAPCTIDCQNIASQIHKIYQLNQEMTPKPSLKVQRTSAPPVQVQ